MATLPATLIGLVWLLPSWRDIRQFLVFHPASQHQSSDVNLELRQILLGRLNLIFADITSSWKSRWQTEVSPLSKVDLEVSPANLALLNEQLPRSGKTTFVQALLRYPNGGFEEVGVRYRGDSLHHWGFAAKSWLIRTEKDQLIDGKRRWHVVLPRWRSVGNYHLNLKLAARMGVLAVDSVPVDLRINRRQHGGIHLLQPQMDEAFLAARGLPAGDLFVGDMTWLDDNFFNEQPKGGMWELPWLWQKAAFNPDYPPESRRPLEMLFFRLNHGTLQEVIDLLDLPAWAKFSAYMQLAAANHMDMGHNWKLFYDPGKLAFVPVVGDGNGLPDNILDLTTTVPGRDLSLTTPLLARLHRSHAFLRLKNQAIVTFFQSGGDGAFFQDLSQFAREVSPTLATFPQLDWMGSVEGRPVHYFDDKALQQRIERVTPALTRWFSSHRDNQTVTTRNISAAVVDPRTLRIAVAGYASTTIGLRLAPGVEPPALLIRIHRADGASDEVDVSPWIRREGDIVWIEWPLLAQRTGIIPSYGGPAGTHETKPTTYDLILDRLDADGLELLTRGPWGDAFAIPRVAFLAPLAVQADNTDVLPVMQTTTYWEGEITVTGITEIRSPLEIRPGTRVRLAPGASVIARGGIVARGTAEKPIRFEPTEAGGNWGTIALIGSQATGSEFLHCNFTGGSGADTPFGRLGGMVSARNAGKLRLEFCRLEESGGDLLSAIHGSLVLRNSLLRQARRDGLDLTKCPARIEWVDIESIRGNAIELTGGDASISTSRLIGSNDHAIVVRGPHHLVVINSLIRGHVIGLHAVDGAQAVAYNATFADNQIPVAASRKTFYHPNLSGIVLAKCAVESAPLPFDLRDDSTLTVLDTQIHGDWNDRLVSRDLLSNAGTGAATHETLAIHGQSLPGSHWNETDPTIRGYRANSFPLPSP